MNRVLADGEGKNLADRAFVSIGRVGRAHDFTVAGNGILSFENLNDSRARGH